MNVGDTHSIIPHRRSTPSCTRWFDSVLKASSCNRGTGYGRLAAHESQAQDGLENVGNTPQRRQKLQRIFGENLLVDLAVLV